MRDLIPFRQPPLADQVLDILIKQIANGVYPPGSQLPSENLLAKSLNVSRSTIRTAISRLEDRKLIHRHQGVGTYVSEHLHISNPLNEFIEFPQLIKANGYDPGFKVISSEIIQAKGDIVEDLHLEAGSQVLKIRKIFTANNDPIIYVVNHIPVWIFENVLPHEEALNPNTTENFIAFFEETCHQRISHFISTVRADIYANIDAPDILINDGPATPLLLIDEVGYNENEQPIVSSREYHPGNWMTFRMIRRRGTT
jgi:GntR family transcriptional regulator